ncbi:MAG: thiamine pyrophosphate-dependent enzyme, partial [Dehalococcoidia bacterium]
MMQPRVKGFVADLESLIDALRERGRQLLAAGTDPDTAASLPDGETLAVSVAPGAKEEIARLAETRKQLEDLHWRYVDGPSGRGRSALGIANSTGCSSVWGSTFPYNPYPYPWVNHLFQDAPSIAIGVFEGHMRKMADAFAAVRRARLYLDGAYNPAEHEPFFEAFDWRQFDDNEFGLCPPILAIGGDGAMFDIGFQNLSRLLASGKPIRVIVVDTQVYSNTGGQACTSGFFGQVSDMAAYGSAAHGKEETRKEISMIAMAHRGAFVAQTSQASPAHLISCTLKALQTRRPALVNIYTPCPVEHGLADDWAPHAARLALESRAFPYLVFDPDAGPSLADCLNLEGNPSLDDRWPVRELEYSDENGQTQRMELPLTIADWAATEGRFGRHFSELGDDVAESDLLRFDEFLEASPADREGKTAYIYTLDGENHLTRLRVSEEMADLAEDRLLLWSQLRQLAGLEVPDVAFRTVEAQLEERFAAEADRLRADYEAKIADLKASYPKIVARRLAEGLLRANGSPAGTAVPVPSSGAAAGIAASPAAAPASFEPVDLARTVEAPPSDEAGSSNGASPEAAAPEATGPTIDTELCTTCEECVNINRRMFAYNESKQAYIKDATAGTYRELVMAAERCTARIIHPGRPLNPNERDLEKWIKRAEPFNLDPVV